MKTRVVKVNEQTHKRLQKMSTDSGLPLKVLIARATTSLSKDEKYKRVVALRRIVLDIEAMFAHPYDWRKEI